MTSSPKVGSFQSYPTVPANYSYLPSDSALSSLFQTMDSLSSEQAWRPQEFILKTEIMQFPLTVGAPLNPHKLDVLGHLLMSLVACEEAQFPPAGFSGFLSPLLRYGEC